MTSMGMFRRFVLASVTLLALCTTNVAFADDPLAKPKDTTAQQRLAAGNKLYRVREFEKAVEDYKAGALIEDVPVFHYNLGQCYRQLGKYNDAIWHYERFIERGKPVGQLRGAVDAFLTQMRAELEKKAMSQPPVEPAPEPKPAPPPQPKTKKVKVPGAPWYRDRIGWGFTAAGLVGLGVSSGLLASANNIEDDANREMVQTKRESLRDRASNRRTIGTIAGIGGAALLVGGLIKLALRPPDREETVTTLDVGITGDGVFVMGKF